MEPPASSPTTPAIDIVPGSEGAGPETNPPPASVPTHLRILFIGNNGAGKSSLINKFSGKEIAEVGNLIKPTEHKEPLMELECIFSPPDETVGIPITFCDTQGFCDMTTENREIAETVADKMKTANVILICHKLFDERIDRTVREILEELARIFGNDLMQHTILVFTKGDLYPGHIKGTNNEIQSKMVAHANEFVKAWKDVLLSTGLVREDIVKDIPWCITSGEEDKLPTSDDWTRELWDLCEKRCTRDAKAFVSSIRRHAVTTILKTAVVTATATVGGIIGTFMKPGGGTAAGMITGASIGVVAVQL